MKKDTPEPITNIDLDIEEELKFTRTSWRLQKVAWVALFVILSIVCGGLFGDGMLSEITDTKQHVSIHYVFTLSGRKNASGYLASAKHTHLNYQPVIS